MLRKMIMMLWLCAACTGAFAGKTFKVHVKKPGTLSEYIAEVPPADRKLITKMIVSGQLNSDDAFILRYFAGCGRTQERTKGQVTSLDLRNAEFVQGGYHYLDYNAPRRVGPRRNTIPAFLFRNCHLEEIVLPEKLERIEEGAFEFTDLRQVVIPANVRHIGDYAFNECWSLEEIKLPEELNYVGMLAFTGSELLKRLDFGAVEQFGNQAIRDCRLLREIIFKGRVRRYNIVVENCPELRNMDFQGGLDNPRNTDMARNCPKLLKVAVKKDKQPLDFYLY